MGKSFNVNEIIRVHGSQYSDLIFLLKQRDGECFHWRLWIGNKNPDNYYESQVPYTSEAEHVPSGKLILRDNRCKIKPIEMLLEMFNPPPERDEEAYKDLMFTDIIIDSVPD